MVEEILVKENLSQEMINAGKHLVELLDRRKLHVSAALWFYFLDSNCWKLIISSPEVNKHGPKKMYQIILRFLKQIRSIGATIGLENVIVIKQNDKLLLSLKPLLRTSRTKISFNRVSRNTVNGILIHDALVYRLY